MAPIDGEGRVMMRVKSIWRSNESIVLPDVDAAASEPASRQPPGLVRRLMGYSGRLVLVYALARALPFVVTPIADHAGVGAQMRCAIVVIWIAMLFIAAHVVRRAWNDIAAVCDARLTAAIRQLRNNNKRES